MRHWQAGRQRHTVLAVTSCGTAGVGRADTTPASARVTMHCMGNLFIISSCGALSRSCAVWLGGKGGRESPCRSLGAEGAGNLH